MKNILKLYGGLGTQLTHKVIAKAKWQLAVLYFFAVVVIVSVTTFFTYNIYIQTIKSNFDYNLTVLLYGTQAGEQFAAASASHILHILLIIDGVVLVLVMIFGYFFAARTLRPVDQAMKVQKQFTADVAHELRTPLAVIQTAIETLPDKALSVAEVQEMKVDLLEETGSLIAMTNNLLTLNEMESHATQAVEPAVVKCQIDVLCHQEVKKMTVYAQPKHIQLHTEIASKLFLYTDAHLVRHILKNLLKNAIDYTPADGKVELSAQPSATGVVIEIQDTGVGIPTADQQHIFNRFYKSPHNKHLSQGSGLGLALVRSFTDLLSGEIILKSVVGEGTTVIIKLPNLK